MLLVEVDSVGVGVDSGAFESVATGRGFRMNVVSWLWSLLSLGVSARRLGRPRPRFWLFMPVPATSGAGMGSVVVVSWDGSLVVVVSVVVEV